MKILISVPAFYFIGAATAAAVDCSHAVSLVAHMNNDQCQALCATSNDPVTDSTYTQYCATAHYTTESGRVVPSHPCITNIVYGNTPSTILSARGQVVAGDGSKRDPTTPAECQLACQQDDDCQRWSYDVDMKRCILNSREAVESVLDLSDENCPVTVQEACDREVYDCLTCNGIMSCAWHGAKELSGWKYCASKEDACSSPGYAVCERQASIDANVTNVECQTRCNTILGGGATVAELETDEDYNAICSEQTYRTLNERAISTGTCYNNLVYGLFQDDDYASLVPDLITSTPALCQAECQAADQCISFSWVSSIASTLTGATVGQCFLKSAKMLEKAKELDSDYCDADTAAYGWLNCEGKEACAWVSSYHISGQRSCANITSLCRVITTQGFVDGVHSVVDSAANGLHAAVNEISHVFDKIKNAVTGDSAEGMFAASTIAIVSLRLLI